MSKKLQDQATTTTTPTNWFVNIAGGVRQLTAAAFNSLIGSLLGTQTHAATAKTTLVDADELPISDSAASNATKKITWANLWLAIKAKADLVYAAVAHSHSAADLTSGTLPDARFPSTLPALNGSALTNLNAEALTTGTIDVARIPLLYSGVQVVSSGAIADLTSPQQATVTGGAIVTTTDGRRWIYKGSGGKTTEASYIETADVTPEWSVIANKPSTFAPSAHAASHKSGGADEIKLDELAAPTDVTTLNATTSAHGLLPKLGGGTTNFLRADGSWAAPAGGGGGASFVTGMEMDYAIDAAPTGWVRKNGLTIGNASSSATERANDDTADLYALLWNNYGDSQCPVAGGRGSDAASDFAGNKTLTLPNAMGRVSVPQISGGAFGTLGDAIGEASHALTEGENGTHSHSHQYSIGASSITTDLKGYSAGDTTVVISAGASTDSTQSSGSGTPHNNIQPSIVTGCRIIKL